MTNDKFPITNKPNGYTLIEILVGLTIVALLFAVGYVNFRDFARRQAIAGAGKVLEGDIRDAQQMALSGEKPNDVNCNDPNTLTGYYFNIASNTEYRIRAGCSAGNASDLTKDVFLPSGITITSTGTMPVLFKVLGQGTNIPLGSNTVITLNQAATNNNFSLTISSGGGIQ